MKIYRTLVETLERSEATFHLGKFVQLTLEDMAGYFKFRNPQVLRQYLRTHEVKKLQLGSGIKLLDGWLNSDCSLTFKAPFFLNIKKTFPISDNTFDYVFSEHVIEHFSLDEGVNMLKESYRILKPGGTVRISCPDLEKLINLKSGNSAFEAAYTADNVDKAYPLNKFYTESLVINNIMRNWGHKFIYDSKTLAKTLEAAGFKHIQICLPCESKHANLQNLESTREENEFKYHESLVMEATK